MNEINKIFAVQDEANRLISKGCTSQDTEFKTWHNKTELFIVHIFGNESFEHNQFNNIAFYKTDFSKISSSQPRIDQAEVCRQGLIQARELLSSLLDLIVDKYENEESEKRKAGVIRQLNYNRVFVVHGHNGELKESVARIIEKQGIEAVILSEQANQGRTIIEKFEDYSDVGGAICLFTADDFGRSKKEDADQNRARQNVVFETGFFMGSLGREHVVILADDGIEMPSDLSGVVYTGTANWQVDLLRDLKAMGYTVDFNKLF